MQILGLKEEDEKPEIDYRERVPPRGAAARAECPPQKSAAEANPNWPKDYDLQRRAAARRRRRRRSCVTIRAGR